MDWDEAAVKCAYKNSKLARVNNEETNNLVRFILK